MAFRVFIDGGEGTTGLQLESRLKNRADIELLKIEPSLRKEPSARRELMLQADATFLCLPDAAAIEAAELFEGAKGVLLDASTAHRVAPGWAYGFPELSAAHKRAIANGRRIAVPGCHATGLISIAYPLVALGVMGADYPLTCHSITGYSGGGKKMIAQYESPERPESYESPRQYGLGLKHKHLPEMQMIPGLANPPIFNPIVCDYYEGMAVSVPVYGDLLRKCRSTDELFAALTDFYAGARFVKVLRQPEDGFLPANILAGTNELHIYVCGSGPQSTLVAVFDNLGKGASGAAVQCMNLALGCDEGSGL